MFLRAKVDKWRLSVTVVQWLESHLHNCTLIVTLGGFHSDRYNLVCRSPPGSILSPLPFILCVIQLADNISKHSSINCFNDMQLLIPLSTADLQNKDSPSQLLGRN